MRHFSNFAIPYESKPTNGGSSLEEALVRLGCPACGFVMTRALWCLKENDSIICDQCAVTIELVKPPSGSHPLDQQMYQVAKTLQALLSDVQDDLEADLLGR